MADVLPRSKTHLCRSPYKGLITQPLKPKWIYPSPGGKGGFTSKDIGTKAELKWEFEVKYGIFASPAIDNEGNVFFSTTSIQPIPHGILGDYYLYALNDKGEKLWSYPFKGLDWGAPAIDKDGTIYVGIIQGEAGVCSFGPARE